MLKRSSNLPEFFAYISRSRHDHFAGQSKVCWPRKLIIFLRLYSCACLVEVTNDFDKDEEAGLAQLVERLTVERELAFFYSGNGPILSVLK